MKIIAGVRVSEAKRPRLIHPCKYCDIPTRNMGDYCSRDCAKLAKGPI